MPSELPTLLSSESAQPAAEPANSPGHRAPQLVLTLLFLLVIASVGIIQTAVELMRGKELQALQVFRQQPTSANLRAYEQQLQDRSLVARALRPWFQLVQFRWFHDAGDKALLGRKGWFFYKPGYHDLIARPGGPVSATNDVVAAIKAFRDDLQSRGIQLLMVPAPNKESVYPEMLTTRAAGKEPIVSPTTSDLFRRLKAANVACLDLFTTFREARNGSSAGAPLYLAQDSHWSPTGVQLAAKVAAGTLIRAGWVQPGATEYIERPVSIERVGDVVRMLQSPRIERLEGAENVQASQVIETAGNKPYADDPDSQVLILGDSFLRIYQQDEPGAAGFIAHLAKELKQPVTSLVNDGGASTLVRQELFRRPALLRNKKVVIWEFVERDIRLGTEGWQHVPLP